MIVTLKTFFSTPKDTAAGVVMKNDTTVLIESKVCTMQRITFRLQRNESPSVDIAHVHYSLRQAAKEAEMGLDIFPHSPISCQTLH
jgi:hypothetical protein